MGIYNITLNENYVFSKDDIYINFDKWKKEKGYNILYITGLSGSGKTTLAEEFEKKYDAEMVELDGIEYNYDSSHSKFIEKAKEKYPEYKAAIKKGMNKLNKQEMIKLLMKIYHFIISEMEKTPTKLYIIEGIQIFELMNPDKLKSKPVVIKGTSMITSMFRRFNRPDRDGKKMNWIDILKNEFPNLCMWYVEMERDISKFKKDINESTLNEDFRINKSKIPDIMYFGSANKIDELKGHVFLSPLKGIASLFIIGNKSFNSLRHCNYNKGYKEWGLPIDKLKEPLKEVHVTHNIKEIDGKESGTSKGYIYTIDISDKKDKLSLFVTNDQDRELIYDGKEPLNIIKVEPHQLKWTCEYDQDNADKHGYGIINEFALTEASTAERKFKCPFCNYHDTKIKLVTHIENSHRDMIPKGYTAARVLFNNLNHKDHGTCIVCGEESEWNEDTYRYDRLCKKKSCKLKYVANMRANMRKVYGKENLLGDAEHQKKMLAGRSISVVTTKPIKEGEEITINYNELPDELKSKFMNNSIIHELNIKNSINKDFKNKQYISLSKFKKYKLDKDIINKYKNTYKSLKHIRIENTDGYFYIDNDKLVCYIIVEEKKDGNWIQALEVFDEYKGYRLSKQLLSVAINDLHANRLSVNKSNKLAIDIYIKFGFKQYDSSDKMIFMNFKNIEDSAVIQEASIKVSKVKCPFCTYHDTKEKLVGHIEKTHQDMIPKGYSAARVLFNNLNHKDHGTCIVCGKESKWNEDTYRYNRLCGNPKCKEKYVANMRANMKKVYGKENLLGDAEHQKKMLAGRSISGIYKFQDGGRLDYVGTYEKNLLEFMDKVLEVKSSDIYSPGPVIDYMYKGESHQYISDYFYDPYNLIIEVKDGGNNPNNREMQSYREKQIAKEDAIKKLGKYNYIRLTNNEFQQLILTMMKIKEQFDEDSNSDEIIVDINEYMGVSGLGGALPAGNPVANNSTSSDNAYIIPCYMKNVYAGSMMSDDEFLNNVYRVKDNKVVKDNVSCLTNYDYDIYKIKKKVNIDEIVNTKESVLSYKDYFYTAITGKELLDENQFEFDECLESVEDPYIKNLVNMKNIIESITYKFNNLLNKEVYVDVFTESDVELRNSKLSAYNNIDIKQDMKGYFVYNTITECRSRSYESINEIPETQFYNIENLKI